MSIATYHVGDVFDVMATLPDNSVDLMLTSPPFLALRSYLPADHPDKGKEIGSEANPAEFVDVLLALTAEWRRLLTPHGSIAVELGDTYANQGGQAKVTSKAFPWREAGWSDKRGPTGQRLNNGPGWPMNKSLALIPEAYRLALAYGVNPHTGQPSPADQWRIRNVVRWVRPNPPVGALGDKYRPATSEMVVACVGKDRWFDLDAVREPLTDRAQSELDAGGVNGGESYQGEASDGSGYKGTRLRKPAVGGGAPPKDWWHIPTQPYKGAHYATWPERLCETPIKSMCPLEVCRECGEPRRRITEDNPELAAAKAAVGGKWKSGGTETGLKRPKGADRVDVSGGQITLGWSDCGHDNYRPGLVLDPFAGSGTTLAVATGHGRDAIGIDIDERNLDLARQRVGMFLTA